MDDTLIVMRSASAATTLAAIDDVDAALGIGWSRGKMIYTAFGNLTSKSPTDPLWGGTAKQFQNPLAVARYFTEKIGMATENLATLRGVICSVTPDNDVSTTEKIVQPIGTLPPGGRNSEEADVAATWSRRALGPPSSTPTRVSH